MRALLVPPSYYGYTFTLSEYSGWKKAGSYVKCFHQSGGCTFYCMLCTYTSYTIFYHTTYTIYYIYVAVSWLYKRLIHRGSRISQQRSQPLAPAVCKLCGWATHRIRQVTESRRRDDPANCIVIAVALHDHMYRIFDGTLQTYASSLMATI